MPHRALVAQHEQLEVALLLEHHTDRRERGTLQGGPVAPLLAVAGHVEHHRVLPDLEEIDSVGPPAEGSRRRDDRRRNVGRRDLRRRGNLPPWPPGVLLPHLLVEHSVVAYPERVQPSRLPRDGVGNRRHASFQRLPVRRPFAVTPRPVLELVVGADCEDVHAARPGRHGVRGTDHVNADRLPVLARLFALPPLVPDGPVGTEHEQIEAVVTPRDTVGSGDVLTTGFASQVLPLTPAVTVPPASVDPVVEVHHEQVETPGSPVDRERRRNCAYPTAEPLPVVAPVRPYPPAPVHSAVLADCEDGQTVRPHGGGIGSRDPGAAERVPRFHRASLPRARGKQGSS